MYVLVHKFSNFKVVQIIKFKDAEVNVLGSNPIFDFDLVIILIALFCNFLNLLKQVLKVNTQTGRP